MNFKKTALASAIALALAGGSIMAETSTVDGEFILDKTTVRGGDIVNLALLGLDKYGEVDLFGEQKGSVIIATVRSEIGIVVGGDTDPGEQASEEVSEGNFAGDVKYIRLTQGTGRVHIQYEPETKGTDQVEVILQERRANPSGGVEFIEIARTTKTIEVVQAESSNPLGLDITAFIASTSDTRGKTDCIGQGGVNESCAERDDDDNIISMPMPNDGILGAMTASQEGGKIYVEAINPIAVGDVTVTLRKKDAMAQCPQPEAAEPIAYTARMQKGQASVTVDSKVVKAGEYYIEATFTSLGSDGVPGEPFDGDSVDLFYSDTVMVHGTGVPSGLALCSDKTVIAKAEAGDDNAFPTSQVAQGTKITAIVVDEYGNITSNNTGENIRVSVQDANGIFSNTSLNLNIPDGTTTSVATDESGPGTDSIVGNTINEIAAMGTTSLVATAVDSSGAALTGITSSKPLELKIVADALKVAIVEEDTDLNIKEFNTSQLAGAEFDAFIVHITDGNGNTRVDSITGRPADPGAVTITTSVGEVLTVNRKNETPYHIQALFKKATDKGTYLIGDALGNFGQTLITVTESDPMRIERGIVEAGILPAAATVVELQNAHGIKRDTVNPGPITAEDRFETKLYEASFKMFDEYGNSVTGVQPLEEDDTGTFRISSANGTSVTHPPRGYGIPGRVEADGRGEVATIVYDTDGEGAFAGEDTIQVTFTKPGLGVDGLSVKTTVPKPHTQAIIDSYIESTDVPMNSIVAMTVELTDETGSPFSGATEAFVTFEINAADVEMAEDIEIITPKVSEIYWSNVPNRPEDKCKEIGGIFDGETATADGGIFIGNCWQVTETPVNSGANLNFTPIDPSEPVRLTPPSSKVFAINVGATKGQFSLTFYNSSDPEGEKDVRIFNVEQALTIVPLGEQEECEANGDLWKENKGCHALPEAAAGGMDKRGEALDKDKVNASFKSGVQIANGEMKQLETASMISDLPINMIFGASITFDEADIGQTVDLVVGVIYTFASPIDGVSGIFYDFNGGYLDPWDFQISTLNAYKESHEIIASELTVSMPLFDAEFPSEGVVAGTVDVYVGYRLNNGDIKFSIEPTTLILK
ncbi:MAG: hypothetical protein IMF12_01310 [Proteobacteria bacterium]|nr:hypothetical protein [Pseudomonadota bacterium]